MLTDVTDHWAMQSLVQSEPKPSTSSTADIETLCQPTTSVLVSSATATNADYEPAAKIAASTSSSRMQSRRVRQKRMLNTAENDSQLFNNWLSSEIEKNNVKIELMKSQIELNKTKTEHYDMLKHKTTLEIQSLTPFMDSAVFDTEQ